jgi:hypothetical protein
MQDQLQRRGHTVYRRILLVGGGFDAIGAVVQFGRGALRGSQRIAFALGLIGYATLLQRIGEGQFAGPITGPRSRLPSLP